MVWKLTGREQYRQGRTIFGRKIVVLQHEYMITKMENVGKYNTVTYFEWRDARPEDVKLGMLNAKRAE